MKVVIRADASTEIGTGHVMRCLTLALALKRQGDSVTFICGDREGHMAALIRSSGFDVFLIDLYNRYSSAEELGDVVGAHMQRDAAETVKILAKLDAEWLVVDHYEADHGWHLAVSKYVLKVMVIDDMANRRLECDLLLDQNYFHDVANRYQLLVSEDCRCLLGPDFSLFRQDILQWKQFSRSRQRTALRRVLVFMGGADHHNETQKVVEALGELENAGLAVDVVVGGSNVHASLVRQIVEGKDGYTFYQSAPNFAELMANADLAIGAGGVAALERCYLGLPALVLVTADNQEETTLALHERGALVSLGWHTKVTKTDLGSEIRLLVDNPAMLESMSIKSLNIFDDNEKGGGERVAIEMSQLLAKQ